MRYFLVEPKMVTWNQREVYGGCSKISSSVYFCEKSRDVTTQNQLFTPKISSFNTVLTFDFDNPLSFRSRIWTFKLEILALCF